jgi:hypothetical protein
MVRLLERDFTMFFLFLPIQNDIVLRSGPCHIGRKKIPEPLYHLYTTEQPRTREKMTLVLDLCFDVGRTSDFFIYNTHQTKCAASRHK